MPGKIEISSSIDKDTGGEISVRSITKEELEKLIDNFLIVVGQEISIISLSDFVPIAETYIMTTSSRGATFSNLDKQMNAILLEQIEKHNNPSEAEPPIAE